MSIQPIEIYTTDHPSYQKVRSELASIKALHCLACGRDFVQERTIVKIGNMAWHPSCAERSGITRKPKKQPLQRGNYYYDMEST